MNILDNLERKWGRYAVPNATILLIAGQSILYVFFLMGKLERGTTFLAGGLVLTGEWWRLLTFPFNPPLSSPVFAIFAWYLFYLMGSALEAHWGAFRYNAFLLAGYLLTVGASFLVPGYPVTNAYLGASVFLAFAFLYPDFVLHLFFILPVRIKWLAVLTWLGLGYAVFVGGWPARLIILASVGNFLLFFGSDLLRRGKDGRRQAAWRTRTAAASRQDGPFHRCTVCGISDRTHPEVDFRYCPQCDGQYGYCQEHIFNHEHVRKDSVRAA